MPDLADPSSEQAAALSPAGEGPHIVDVLIEERARHLKHNRLAWPLIRAVIYPLLRYPDAIRMADQIAALSGRATFDLVARILALKPKVSGLEHVPREGACIIVANHPTGMADGIALYEGLKGVREDLKFIANRDALRVSPGLADVVIPVEWVIEKRTVAKTRDMWRETRAAFKAGQCVVMFPSGRVAQLRGGRLIDRPWQSAAIAFAKRNNAPIVPLHIAAWNSWVYYFFARVSTELRDMTLFNELFNKRGKEFRLTFGPVIPHEDLPGDPEAEILRLRKYIELELPAGRSWGSAD